MRLAVATLAVGLALPAALAAAATPGKVFFEDTIPSGQSSSVTFTTHRPAGFQVLLRAPTEGRARLFLTGKKAPKGINPLMDTKASYCQGAAGSFYCKSAYEPLPKGTYTWRVSWVSTVKSGPKRPAHIELTVRW